MPISEKDFNEKGRSPKKRRIQERIIEVLSKNPNHAFSSIELEEICKARRESINQALRSLEQKGKIKRGTIYNEVSKRNVMYAQIQEG